MKQEYSIELLEEYENINFYSIRIAGEELTELEAASRYKPFHIVKNQRWHYGACG